MSYTASQLRHRAPIRHQIVLGLLIRGLSQSQVGRRLGISSKTVWLMLRRGLRDRARAQQLQEKEDREMDLILKGEEVPGWWIA